MPSPLLRLSLRSLRSLRTPTPFTRPASSSATSGGAPTGTQHATDTSDELDVQSSGAKQGQRDKAAGQGGQAATQADERNNNQRAKDENPEAPGPVLGMNDERGGVSSFAMVGVGDEC